MRIPFAGGATARRIQHGPYLGSPDIGESRNVELERRRNDADQRERSAAEPDRTSDCCRIASKVAAPESFADHDNVGRRAFVTGLKRAARNRLHPEHVEEVAGHDLGPRA